MTATVSTDSNKNVKKFSPPLHNWKQNVKSSKKLAVILTVLHMVAMPTLLLSIIINIYSGNGFYESDGIITIAILTTALAGFMGIFPAVNSFACLNDKTVVDMRLSLPMTAAQRFVSNFLSGLFTYIVPFLSAQVFSLLFALYGRLFMEGRTFYHVWYDGSVRRETPYICEGFADILPMLIKLIIGGALAMLMLYTITVLITVCCGSKFESIAYTILINAVIPLTVISVTYSIFEGLYGINSATPAYKIIIFTSTAGGILAAVDWATGGESFLGLSYTDGFNYGVWAILYLLIIAALAGLAFFLYRKRRAEQVSKPFVFKLAYYITITCGIFCIIAISEEPVPAIIITAVVYMIFEVVTNRGFKRFWLSIIKYIGTFIAAAVLIFVGQETEGFGAVYRVPAAATVTSAEIYYEGYYGDFDSTGNNYSSKMPVVLKDKENIRTILSVHKTAVQDYREYKKSKGITFSYTSDLAYAPITIKYNLIGGGSLYRRYLGLCTEAAEMLTEIDTSEEYKAQIAEIYKERILNIPTDYNAMISEMSKNERYIKESDYKAYAINRMLSNDNYTSVTVSSLCARGFYEQLAEAYCKDIMAINEENYFRSELKNVWTFYTCNEGGRYSINSPALTVPESFENTVALLEKFDFNLKHIETADEREILDYLIQAASGGYVQLYTENKWRKMTDYGEGELHSAWRGSTYDEYAEYFVYDFDKNFIELLRSAMPRNIVSENGYIISVYSFTGAVPEEMNEAAAAVTRRGRDDETQKLYYDIAYGERAQYYK